MSATDTRVDSDAPVADPVPSSTATVDKDVEQQPTKTDLVDQTQYLPRRYVIQVFLACASVGMTGLLDETMVAVALPLIASDLNTGSQISAVATAYFITSTACQMLYGRISDIWSRKSVLLALLVIFFLGNLASSLAQTFTQILVFRAIVGVGGGGIGTVAQIIVSDVVSLRQRGKYQGILGASVALANGVGPLIGGALASTSTDGWRWIFRVELPLTVFSAAGVIFFMPLKPVEGGVMGKLAKVDFVGAGLALLGTTLLVLGISWGGSEYTWKSGHVIGTLVGGGVSAVAFVLWQWKGATIPLMPLHIFKNRVVVGGVSTHTLNGFLTVVQVFYLPTFYQTVYGYSAVKSGAMILPIVLVQTAVSTLSGIIISLTGRYRELILCGWATWAIGLGLITTFNAHTSLAKQIGYSIIVGLGVGQTFQPSLVAIQGAVERREMAVITSVRMFVRNLGGTVGLAICGTVVNVIFRKHLATLDLPPSTLAQIIDNPVLARLSVDPETLDQIVEGYRQGFRVVFIILVSVAGLGLALASGLMVNYTLHRDDDAALKDAGRKFLERKRKKEKGEEGEAKE
ncbi:major facilitator superfamily transporter [Ceratobasidium sp. AG-Ba]|nr:major facilitator superfamily transporter [Ceratobasidium sp. AG-Ba]QRV99653.1 major facilitator superfamily transporter [Ceratobasidium sp. AG-Ba]QRW14187.1 major facilitator superfamily transporter [Ceratobasidium sp. AG-Ba]